MSYDALKNWRETVEANERVERKEREQRERANWLPGAELPALVRDPFKERAAKIARRALGPARRRGGAR